VFPNEFFDVGLAEAGQLPKPDARQAWLLAGDVVIDPCLAHAEPLGDLRNVEERFGMSIPLVRHTASQIDTIAMQIVEEIQ
jgi:hypothetical protein